MNHSPIRLAAGAALAAFALSATASDGPRPGANSAQRKPPAEARPAAPKGTDAAKQGNTQVTLTDVLLSSQAKGAPPASPDAAKSK